MNWNARYANDAMMQHFKKHVLTPAREFSRKSYAGEDWDTATSADPEDKEIANCVFCQNPEYMVWEHETIGSPQIQVSPAERGDVMMYHFDNHLTTGHSCFTCDRNLSL